jgi:hypothetical protein
VDEIDVWRTAQLLIEEHGADARSHAVHFASKMLEHRNYQGYEVWGLVWTAIRILQERSAAKIT